MNEQTVTKPALAPAGGAAAGEAEVFARLVPLIVEVTGAAESEIAMASVLTADLGAESLDLLDLSFLIEEAFGIRIEADEFEARAKARLAGAAYEEDGYLTPAALAELRRALPEVPPARLGEGLRKMDIPSVLSVAVFVHLIQRKLLAAAEGAGHADGDA